jgi:DNA repair photolyase
MREHPYRTQPAGRAASTGPPNRFEKIAVHEDWEDLAPEDIADLTLRSVATQFLPDASQSIISSNSSPDVPFNVSLNPYRGCEHGCSYCYARPTHEYLGLGAGLDFETKVLVKYDAAELLRKALCAKSWKVQPIAFSGVTDCYQPVERKLRLTRACLEVLLEARHPVTIITKNALIVRDLNLLSELAKLNLVHAAISITTLDADLARRMEPRTSTPTARLNAIRRLADSGIPVTVMNAPMIPGLNDHEIPSVLTAAREAGAQAAGYVLLRLPLSVEPVFSEWLRRELPDKADRILALVRETRGGKSSDSRFRTRMRGEGSYADQIAATFRIFRNKLAFCEHLPKLDCSLFQKLDGQRRLF